MNYLWNEFSSRSALNQQIFNKLRDYAKDITFLLYKHGFLYATSLVIGIIHRRKPFVNTSVQLQKETACDNCGQFYRPGQNLLNYLRLSLTENLKRKLLIIYYMLSFNLVCFNVLQIYTYVLLSCL